MIGKEEGLLFWCFLELGFAFWVSSELKRKEGFLTDFGFGGVGVVGRLVGSGGGGQRRSFWSLVSYSTSSGP